MTSISPLSITRSSCSSTSALMRGRMSATRRAVKALVTSPRRRVWSGGSSTSMVRARLATAGSFMPAEP